MSCGAFCHSLWQFPYGGQFCHRLWQKVSGVRIGPIERDHAANVSFGESLLLRQFVLKLSGQTGDSGGSPARLPLAIIDHPAYIPIETDQLRVHGENCPRLSLLNAPLDFVQQMRVTDRCERMGLAHVTLITAARHQTGRTTFLCHRPVIAGSDGVAKGNRDGTGKWGVQSAEDG